MRLYTSDSLHYPITVTKLYHKAGDDIAQNARLFSYEYKSWVIEGTADNKEGEKVLRSWIGDFESELEGKLLSFDVQEGQVIKGRTAVADLDEPCRHEVQFAGMCADCGKDMTLAGSYNATKRDSERATVSASHKNTKLLISQEAAGKADEEAKRRLLDSRKLSLVVDLDQTVVHACCDPTVWEWMQDPTNPNHEAVKDVKKFLLEPERPGGRRDWYYIKQRPGLRDFLDRLSKLYEMHVYTMGTRNYAENVVKVIDPQGKVFADRILSRDENGEGVTKKNLRRLFPVDSAMVTIIDDRGDVWTWSPNLVKVNAFDFFPGTGDINSSFLPKRPGIDETPKAADETQQTDASPKGKAVLEPSIKAADANGNKSMVADQMASMAGDQSDESFEEKTHEQGEKVEKQIEDRPLLKKQKMLEQVAEKEAETSPAAEAAAELLAESNDRSEAEHHEHNRKYRSNLLTNDDHELVNIETVLSRVHRAFYNEYEKVLLDAQGGRVAELRPSHGKKRSHDSLELHRLPDAAAIMSNMKEKVLRGVHLVFSGVIPIGVPHHSHDTVIWAKTFGATVSEHITKKTTHVIASPERRTAKVRQALKKGGRINVVSQKWLLACLGQWSRVGETPYRIHMDLPVNGSPIYDLPEVLNEGSPTLSSSDEEAAVTEDETESNTPTPSAHVNGAVDGLSLDTDVETELARYAPTDAQLREDSSPTETEQQEDWGEINDELADFLGSDFESDSELSEAAADTDVSDREGGTSTPRRKRKRKRADTSSTDGESESGPDGEGGSKLQRRKKQATSRVTSLATVHKAPSSKSSTPGPTDEKKGEDGDAKDAQDLDDEAEMEAALEAAFEDEDEDDE